MAQENVGMPQLDTAAWPTQLFWLAVTFIALYIIISRVAIPRTGGAIEKRKSTIDGDLAQAQKLKGESEAAVAAYEADLAEARARANAIAAENRSKLDAEIEAERAKLDGKLAGKIAEAEKSIAAAKATALADIKGVAADIAASIVNELTGVSVASADAAAAIAKTAK
jgi:F-type H+-transporting ATPase subunit b